ncbi:hypothetical protein BU24DRAFT_490137 [Aaosphaeria arxii CBS 175.79]|uniref:Uncharacterized protein n=1 Tax=Aaosphaeria arxii CBS 175.79 TaxID=1450172 RepID=A0A6A5XV92_9PLEO|nr:uncharacterized protein BU24DRAFT_490137 [Aaosphaeria arxii CBS 175.79]KAF2016853.1 hypothetical protein BU24DRAFT_490137 [Aaosphaeria arxii CBS 175.79]
MFYLDADSITPRKVNVLTPLHMYNSEGYLRQAAVPRAEELIESTIAPISDDPDRRFHKWYRAVRKALKSDKDVETNEAKHEDTEDEVESETTYDTEDDTEDEMEATKDKTEDETMGSLVVESDHDVDRTGLQDRLELGTKNTDFLFSSPSSCLLSGRSRI